MRRLLVVLLLAAGMVLVSPSDALACSCKQATTAEHVDRADTVVAGTVEWVSDNGLDRTYSVSVDQVFKGLAGLREKVHTSASEASCGLGELGTQKQYVFFLDGKHPGRLSAGLCGGTAPYGAEIVTEVQQKTGTPVPPLPSISGEAEAADGGPDKIRIVGIGAFVLAAIAGGVLLFRRRVLGHGRR